MSSKVIPCGKRVFTHTHALSELSCLFEFSRTRKNICANWNLNSLLYLCLVLRCSLIVLSVDYTCMFWHWLEKIWSLSNFHQFFFLVFQCGVSGRSLLASGRVEFSNSDGALFGVRTDGVLSSEQDLFHVRTWAITFGRTGNLIRPDARNHFVHFRGSTRPDGDPTEVINSPDRRSLSTIPHKIPSFDILWVTDFGAFWSDLIPIFLCVHSHSIPGIFLVSFLFSSSISNC
jgi:hypothetical protein